MTERTPYVWPHHEVGVAISADPAQDAELKLRIDAAFRAMMADLNRSMYDRIDGPPRPLSLAEKMRALRWRVRDAWLVLTGRAEIY